MPVSDRDRETSFRLINLNLCDVQGKSSAARGRPGSPTCSDEASALVNSEVA